MDIDEKEGGPEAGPSGVHGVTMVQTNGYHANQKEEGEEWLLDDQEWPLFYPVELGGGLPPTHLTGASDLLPVYDLAQAYNKHVRPYLGRAALSQSAAGHAGDGAAAAAAAAAALTEDSKGKGRATDLSNGADEATVPGANGTAAREKARVMKKHYSHLIADVPGQNRLAKDKHMRDLLLNPDPPDGIRIMALDSQTLRDAFTLDIGTLPDFDASIWKADAGEERKKKKRRKGDEGLANGGPAASAAPSPVGAGGTGKKRRVD